MFIVKYEDSKGNEVTDKTERIISFINLMKIIKKYEYKVLSVVDTQKQSYMKGEF